MTNNQFKKKAQELIKANLGFDVKLNQIVLLETGDSGVTANYLLFEIKGFKKINYQWSRSSGLRIVKIVDDFKFGQTIDLDYFLDL